MNSSRDSWPVELQGGFPKLLVAGSVATLIPTKSNDYAPGCDPRATLRGEVEAQTRGGFSPIFSGNV